MGLPISFSVPKSLRRPPRNHSLNFPNRPRRDNITLLHRMASPASKRAAAVRSPLTSGFVPLPNCSNLLSSGACHSIVMFSGERCHQFALIQCPRAIPWYASPLHSPAVEYMAVRNRARPHGAGYPDSPDRAMRNRQPAPSLEPNVNPDLWRPGKCRQPETWRALDGRADSPPGESAGGSVSGRAKPSSLRRRIGGSLREARTGKGPREP